MGVGEWYAASKSRRQARQKPNPTRSKRMTTRKFRAPVPSRPGVFHPEPLTEPDLILSHHPARAIARRLPPSAEISGSSRFDPVGPSSTAMTRPLCSAGITPLRRYYGAVRPSPAHRYFRPRGWRRLRLVWGLYCQAVSEPRSLFLAFLIGFFVRPEIPF